MHVLWRSCRASKIVISITHSIPGEKTQSIENRVHPATLISISVLVCVSTIMSFPRYAFIACPAARRPDSSRDGCMMNIQFKFYFFKFIDFSTKVVKLNSPTIPVGCRNDSTQILKKKTTTVVIILKMFPLDHCPPLRICRRTNDVDPVCCNVFFSIITEFHVL